MNSVITEAKKPIYLYTIIPDFFIRFGFKSLTTQPPNNPTTHQPISLPPKSPYGCDQCLPGQCVTMVKYPGDTKVS